MTNESILISEVIPATPQRIFSAWMDSAEHSAFTGDEATVVPEVGGEHRAAGGYIQGRTLELNEGSRIVQSWRTTEFPPESPDSRVEITLEPTLGGTLVTLLHTDIPVGQGDRYRQSWNDYYLSRLKTYFSDADDDEDDDTSPVSSVAASAGGRIVSLEVDLDEETAVGDLEPTSVAETPTKVMRTNVKRALATSTRGGPAAHTGDTETVRVTRAAAASAPAGAGKAKPARAATKKVAKVAARRPAKAAKKPMKKVAKAAARRPAKPVKQVAARRAAKPVKKAAAKVSRKPAKKAARPAAQAKRPGAKRKGGAKR